MIATDGDVLLQAILAEPADDLVRLAYADWLDEVGDEAERSRAEFIRVQVELAGDLSRERACREACEPPDYAGCPQRGLRLRERALFTWGNINRWGGRSEAWQRTTVDRKEFDGFACGVGIALFRRGFVESVRLPLAAWQAHGPSLVRSHPITRVECPGVVRSGIVFRGAGDGDVPADFWQRLGLGRCVDGACDAASSLDAARSNCRGRGTHNYFGTQERGEDWMSAALIRWAKLPDAERQ
jgi:uncharacterized protein (TIGR02996 family)